MTDYGWVQLAVFVGILFLVTKPVGIYLGRVLDPLGRTFLDRPLKPIERLIYRVLRLDPADEQDWKGYALSLFVFSAAGAAFSYLILRLQDFLPLNPQCFGPMSGHLAFNTAVSFTSNTNWQNYGGESTLSYFSQMVALTFQNFVSAAVGVAVAAALVRGIARHSAKTIGNLWVDLVRVTLYLLFPLGLVYALFLVSQGVPETFGANVKASGFEAGQTITRGPVASQEAIKMAGTNGGGFFNANSAHPFENPTPLSNFMQMLSIFLIPAGLTWYLGQSVKNKGHGWTIWAAMAALFLTGVLVCWWAEAAGNPRITALGVNTSQGNMEGKEVRFGVASSALFATITTDASCGAVNGMHDSYTPLGGLVPLVNIELGEVVFGGVGAGLYGMLIFVVLTVFLAGLMVGRTPEYLGKKIESYDVKVCVLYVVVTIFAILGFSAAACLAKWGLAGLGNTGPHGFSEILYAYSSCVGNNGSAFAGLNGNAFVYDVTLGLAMLIGRFLVMAPVLALAGSLASKKIVPVSGGSFPVSGFTFGALLVGTVIIVGALTFLPALSLGPIVEHFLMRASAALFG